MEPSSLKVADVMKTSLLMVSGLESVRGAMRRMKEHGVSSLIIERRDSNDEYGVVTVEDIAGKVIARNRSTTRTSVYEVMTKPALTVSGDMNVKYAIRLLARLGLSRALVVGDDGLLGLVTQRDLVLGHQEAGETPE
jgi:signal-transduction protein with cAMP-binding, CBS, and nucleotidyltransferase domain